MLIGEYHHSIDEKNRLIIPSKLREELGSEFVVTRGLDRCLFVYPMEEWQKIVNKLSNLPFTKKDARDFSRFFLSGATISVFDKQGRINITSPLVKYANLNKDCVIIGVNERLEIWNSEDFDTFMNNNLDNFSEISENLFKGEYDA